MRRLQTLAAALTATALGTLPAGAAEEQDFVIDTTEDLVRLCSVPAESPMFAAAIHMCHGYLVGVHHFHTAMVQAGSAPFYCLPEGDAVPSRNEVVAAFVDWVDANPAVAGTEALDGTMTWASTAYPCP